MSISGVKRRGRHRSSEYRAAHGHVDLDGEPQKKFPGTFEGLSKGKHEIKVQAATHDHDHVAATDTITVEVQ